MSMSELKQKLLIYELSKNGYSGAVYIPENGRIKTIPENDSSPSVDDAGNIYFGSEYSDAAYNVIRPLANKVNEIYSAWENAAAIPFKDLTKYKTLAEYNGTVLAARDDTECGRGFHFVTWKYDFNKMGFNHGNYTDDYAYAKEDFAVRAGFVKSENLISRAKNEITEEVPEKSSNEKQSLLDKVQENKKNVKSEKSASEKKKDIGI